MIEVNDDFCIKAIKSILSHFNYVHCGVEMLNMSKQIMNKVFSCADDCDIYIYIYYQYTYSIHLSYGGVDKIENVYKSKYGSELVGEGLGDFRIDFSMDKANTEIYAIESLFLGKGTYIDILEPTDKDGKTVNSEHIIMKGIPTPCIKYYARQKGITVLDVYKTVFQA